MNYVRTISVPANSTIEVFTELSLDPMHVQVTFHSNVPSGGEVRLSEDSEGTNLGMALPWNEEGQVLQFITDKDPVYIANTSGAACNVFVLLAAAA